jgi:hypothetical protein
MTKIVEHTKNKLVVENKPRISFGIAISLGIFALFGSLYSITVLEEELSKDIVFGLALGPIFSIGGLLLYRETITVFDKTSGMVNWQQRGLIVKKSENVKLCQIQKVVLGKPVSNELGFATCITLIMKDRSLPLMFGFSSTYNHKETKSIIQYFISDEKCVDK